MSTQTVAPPFAPPSGVVTQIHYVTLLQDATEKLQELAVATTQTFHWLDGQRRKSLDTSLRLKRLLDQQRAENARHRELLLKHGIALGQDTPQDCLMTRNRGNSLPPSPSASFSSFTERKAKRDSRRHSPYIPDATRRSISPTTSIKRETDVATPPPSTSSTCSIDKLLVETPSPIVIDAKKVCPNPMDDVSAPRPCTAMRVDFERFPDPTLEEACDPSPALRHRWSTELSPDVERRLGVHIADSNLRLCFQPKDGRLWCRACNHQVAEAKINNLVRNADLNANLPDVYSVAMGNTLDEAAMGAHVARAHPHIVQRLLGLSAEELASLRRANAGLP